MLCLKQGGYGGRVLYLLKYGILYIPLYGWYLATVSELIIRDVLFNDHSTEMEYFLKKKQVK